MPRDLSRGALTTNLIFAALVFTSISIILSSTENPVKYVGSLFLFAISIALFLIAYKLWFLILERAHYFYLIDKISAYGYFTFITGVITLFFNYISNIIVIVPLAIGLAVIISLHIKETIENIKTLKDYRNNFKKIKRIFGDLQNEGLIKQNHELVPGKKFESQKLLFTENKTIFYPKEKLERKELSDDAIRFALLHEEGHLSKYKGHHYFMSIVLITVFSSLTIYLFSDPRIPIIGSSLPINSTKPLGIVGIVLLIWILLCKVPKVDLLRQVEHKCDRWAAEKIKKHYGVQKPFVIAQKFVDWHKETRSEKHIIIRILSKPLVLFDPHPLWSKRIEKLKSH